MKNILIAVAALTIGYAAFALLPAQEPAPGQVAVKNAKGAVVDVQAVAGAVVTGAPYSAIAVTEMTQTLGDGNHIVHSQSQKVYRDGQGRERTEAMAATTETGIPISISISDPVAKVSYSLNSQNRTAVQKPLMRVNNSAKQATAQEINDYVARLVTAYAGIPMSQTTVDEDLGPQTIEGGFATGTRTTLTIPAGAVGNEKPILVLDEVWYSPELKANVMTRHDDPRSGERVYRLTQIIRAEPDPSLFQVPPGYTLTVRDNTGGRGKQ